MFLKKIALSLLTISACLAVAKIEAHDSDKLCGHITKGNVKDFMFGIGIGAVHGATNQLLTKVYQRDENNSHKTPYLAHTFTWIAATQLERAYNGSYDVRSPATTWGRGIGQIVAESVKIEKNEKNENGVKIGLEFNLSLILALMKSF